ncbi:hypothetical protein KKG41_02755 [Patescibacteria group bacterium]|nr:hypothetical protein [Patescibacteria group bacterium]MBU1890056.1 hypothetical protein [Patescibacteria group bacterium]
MALNSPQRNAIETLLRSRRFDKEQQPTVPLLSSVQTVGGATLYLLGVSEGRSGRSLNMTGVNIAVFGTQPPSDDPPQLPRGLLVDNGQLVHAAVLLGKPNRPRVANELQVTLLSSTGEDHLVRPSGNPVRFCRAIC